MPQEVGVFHLVLTPTNAPPNDDFSGRFVLSGAQTQANALNYGATLQPGEPNAGEPAMGATLWWTWTAPGSGPATIDTAGSSFDTRLAVYRGSSLGSLNLVSIDDDAGAAIGSYNDFTSSLTFEASRGTTYQIQVGSVAGSLGRLTVNVAGQAAPPPAELISAEMIGSGVCRLHLRGTPGQDAFVQGSTNLVNWESLDTVHFNAADEVWSEAIHPEAAIRFFRLLSEP